MGTTNSVVKSAQFLGTQESLEEIQALFSSPKTPEPDSEHYRPYHPVTIKPINNSITKELLGLMIPTPEGMLIAAPGDVISQRSDGTLVIHYEDEDIDYASV